MQASIRGEMRVYIATILEHARHRRNFGRMTLPDIALEEVSPLFGLIGNSPPTSPPGRRNPSRWPFRNPPDSPAFPDSGSQTQMRNRLFLISGSQNPMRKELFL